MFEIGNIYCTTKTDTELFQPSWDKGFICVPVGAILVYLGKINKAYPTGSLSDYNYHSWLYDGKTIQFYEYRTPAWYLEELFELVEIF